MKRIAVIAAALVAAFASASLAQVAEDQDGWACGTQEDWEIAAFRPAPKLILNNFFFDETSSFRTEMKVLQVEYSTINRQSEAYSMTGQFVGFDEAGAITFAMSASPSYDLANPGSGTAEDDVYIDRPVLSRTAKICAAFAVEAGEEQE